MKQLILPLLTAATLLPAALLPAAVKADSTIAFCSLSVHDHTVMPTPLKPCKFSQYQGNAYIRYQDQEYAFMTADQGKTYTRQATDDFLRFTKEGEYSLTVMWDTPAISCKRVDL